MSAGIKLTQSELSENTPLPNSRRVYVEGKLPGVSVPFREIDQTPSRNFDNTVVAALSQWKFNDGASGRTYDTEVVFRR